MAAVVVGTGSSSSSSSSSAARPTDDGRIKSKHLGLLKHQNGRQSFFVSLTLPSFEGGGGGGGGGGAEDAVRAACAGADLVELRVDLLARQATAAEQRDFVARQVGILRGLTDLGIIYTIRTRAQGGAWPDDDIEGLLGLYELGLALEADFLDVEMHLDSALIGRVCANRGSTLIILSHHDWAGTISWDTNKDTNTNMSSRDTDKDTSSNTTTSTWGYWYRRGIRHGADVVKLVGTAAGGLRDNVALELFRDQTRTSPAPHVPLIAINMGTAGQMSRILNDFLTPVTHPALSSRAAPGQLTVAEIRQARVLMGLA